MDFSEPRKKRVAAFFDCQNLYLKVKFLWGHKFPDFDPIRLSNWIVYKYRRRGWSLSAIYLYTGVPDILANAAVHSFWHRKFAAYESRDKRVHTFINRMTYIGDVPREKGVDVRIALDLVQKAERGEYDVALLFSQDNDFEEAAKEVRRVAQERGCWIKVASAFPFDAFSARRQRGVRATEWVPFEKHEYNCCIDPSEYFF